MLRSRISEGVKMGSKGESAIHRTPVWIESFKGPWIIMCFCPTSLWSLKSSQATSSGGKTLLVPTPYSIKLALIDGAIRTGNITEGVVLFEFLKGRPLRVAPPSRAVVSATFLRIQKIERGESGEHDEEWETFSAKRFSPTVGFREYVYFTGSGEGAYFRIAIHTSGIDIGIRELLAKAAMSCTYTGKRGGFMRFVPVGAKDGLQEVAEFAENEPFTLPVSVWRSSGISVPLGTIQMLDELPVSATWQNVNTFGSGNVSAVQEFPLSLSKRTKSKPDRVFVQTMIPYRLIGSSKGYQYYCRSDAS